MAETMATPEVALAAALDYAFEHGPPTEGGTEALARAILAALSSYSLVPTGEVERLRRIEAAAHPLADRLGRLYVDRIDLKFAWESEWKALRATLTEDETDR